MTYLYFLGALLLSGCSTYQETFECKPGKGVGCRSLSHVNQMVDAGVLPLESTQSPQNVTLPPVKQPMLRIWLADYKDGEGIVHEAALVHVPLQGPTP